MTEETDSRVRVFRLLREAAAVTVWSWSLIKLFVFDVDVYLVQRFAPGYIGLLRYKLLFVLAVISGIWLLLRQSSYFEFVLYVVGYPAVLAWRGLKMVYRHWPLLIAFAPPIYLAIRRARATFALYTLALISLAVIVSGRSPAFVVVGIAMLQVFLIVHIIRRLREAFGSGVFRELAQITKSLEAKVIEYAFAEPTATTPPASTKNNDPNPKQTQRLSQCYMFYAAAEVTAAKVTEIARGRKYDVYLLASWLYTVVLTTATYAFEYLGLSKVAAGAFRNAAGAGVGQFFGFSLGVLTTSNVSEIVPVSVFARWLSYSEVFCSALILIVLVFSLLTAARESYRNDAAEFREALLGIASAVEAKALAAYQLTAAEIERALVAHQREMVNFFRRQRGAPELTPPIDVTPEPLPPAPRAPAGSGT